MLAGVDAYLEQHLSKYIEETARYCAQPSVSAQGEGMAACAQLVREMLMQHGIAAEQYETKGNPIVVGRLQGKSGRTLLFYNHYDVQPPEPLELWTTPPFEPKVRDGKLFARGAKDDKGELVARLAAIDALRDANGGDMPCSVLFVVEGEEEISSPHIAEFVLEHKDILRCHGSIWEEGGIGRDGQPELVLGPRGILAVEISLQTLSRDAHSGGGHIMPSAAWRLVWALASLKGRDERVRIPGFYDAVQSPAPLDLEMLDQAFAKDPGVEEQLRRTYGVVQFAAGRSGKDLLRAVFEPTCNIQGIGSGYQGPGVKTIVPAQARAKVDFRLVPDQDPEDILEKLRRHLTQEGFPDVEVRLLGWMRPSRTPVDDPLVQLTQRTGREVYGGEATILPLTGGSSPEYAFAGPLGIPIVTAGVGYWDNRAHAPNEHVRIEDFHQAARHIARILYGFADLG
ncbi:MAG: M20/M25/M40 family metallo-hydrolase [Thermaerobacter sp.]|nr:M20/M25/M40 family metallo-hydrolase [Thermaerobacter sp.]